MPIATAAPVEVAGGFVVVVVGADVGVDVGPGVAELVEFIWSSGFMIESRTWTNPLCVLRAYQSA